MNKDDKSKVEEYKKELLEYEIEVCKNGLISLNEQVKKTSTKREKLIIALKELEKEVK